MDSENIIKPPMREKTGNNPYPNKEYCKAFPILANLEGKCEIKIK